MANYNCYFSPTGGTRKVADLVAKGWGSAFQSVDLLHLTTPVHFRPGDLCLIAVPSYGGRIPAAAAQRLELLSGSGAWAVLIGVFGNRAIDDTLVELSDLMNRAGFRVLGAMEAVAQHSLLPQFGAGRPDREDAEELAGFACQLKQKLETGNPSEEPKLPGNRPYRSYNGVPLKPSVSSGCIGCGICARECPVGAIPELNYRMTDTKKCISCMRCVAVCPRHVRKVNQFMAFAAGQMMKKSCSDRKPNRLYL